MKEEEIKRLEEKVKALQDEINRIKNSKILSCAGSTNVPLAASISKSFGDGNRIADIKINDHWAYTIFESTGRNYSKDYDRCKNAMLYLLSDSRGVWTDERGDDVGGYLTYNRNEKFK